MKYQNCLSCVAARVLRMIAVASVIAVHIITPTAARANPSNGSDNDRQDTANAQEQILIAPAIAAALIAAGVVVVGGIISWIIDQSDDVTAQGTAVATSDTSPVHCGDPTVSTCADDGFFSANCMAFVENQCGYARAIADVSSPLIGTETLNPYSFAFAKAIHFSQEKHEVFAEAKVAVDKRTRSSRTGLLRVPENSSAHPDGTVLATVDVDSFKVQVREGSGVASSWEFNYVATPQGGTPIDVLHSNGEIASDGTLSVTGDIPPGAFVVSSDLDGNWTVELNGYSHEVVVGFVDVGEELDVQLTADATTVLRDALPDAPTGVTPQPADLSKIVAVVPNPFNPSTTIQYTVGGPGYVDISIYGVDGRLVRTLVARNETAGEHMTTWDGNDANNGRAASGVYFVKLIAGRESHSVKMVLLK